MKTDSRGGEGDILETVTDPSPGVPDLDAAIRNVVQARVDYLSLSRMNPQPVDSGDATDSTEMVIER